jgi:hypothetical protein
MDAYMPIKGKCTWWREIPRADDQYDIRIKSPDKLVDCSCFVEGRLWEYRTADVPSDCPESRRCRYYIKHG